MQTIIVFGSRNRIIATKTGLKDVDPFQSALISMPIPLTGKHVGVNYTSGIYENEIPGANTSGDLLNGR